MVEEGLVSLLMFFPLIVVGHLNFRASLCMCCPPAWMWNRWLSEWMAGVGGLVPGELILMLESVGAASTGGSPCLLILFS